jgi:hypothetical protein
MEKVRKTAVIIAFILSLGAAACASDAAIIRAVDPLYDQSGPQLLYPITDKIVLAGKYFLEFRWLDTMRRVDHFVFKIYKGYNMYAKDLMYKQDVASNASTIKIKAELFERNQVYTWSLMRVSLGGQKSDKSASSFKVIGK